MISSRTRYRTDLLTNARTAPSSATPGVATGSRQPCPAILAAGDRDQVSSRRANTEDHATTSLALSQQTPGGIPIGCQPQPCHQVNARLEAELSISLGNRKRTVLPEEVDTPSIQWRIDAQRFEC